MSQFATVSDEAYTIAYIENSYDAWKAEAEDTDKKGKANYPERVFTNNSSSSTKYGGWTNEGITRYNTYQKLVTTWRSQSVDIEEKYQETAMATMLESGKKKKTGGGSLEPKVEADVNWESDDDDDVDDGSPYGRGERNYSRQELDGDSENYDKEGKYIGLNEMV